MSKELLPELPTCGVTQHTDWAGGKVDYYTADQMRDYGQACYEAGRKSVDLEQFREAVDYAKYDNETGGNSGWAAIDKELDERLDRLLAIIDGEKA